MGRLAPWYLQNRSTLDSYNGPEARTGLDKAIEKYDVSIKNIELEVNEVDRKISDAVAKGRNIESMNVKQCGSWIRSRNCGLSVASC